MRLTLLLFALLCLTRPGSSHNDSLYRQRPKAYGPVYFTTGYRIPVINSGLINSGHGIYTEAGFNAGYFFSERAILGLFAGWGWKDNLWSTAFDGRFASDFRQAINSDLLRSPRDSAIVHAAAGLFADKTGSSPTMPGCEMRSFHDYSLYYGVLLKLPLRCLPALKLYKGSTRSHYQGAGGLVSDGHDYNSFQLRRAMYGCELMFLDPVRFFSRARQSPQSLQRIGISLYYEYSALSTSSLHFSDGESQRLMPVKQFVRPGFFDTYRREQRFGCKISYTFI